MNLAAHIPVLIIVVPLIMIPVIPLIGRMSINFSWLLTLIVTGLSFVMSLMLMSQVWASGPVSYYLGGWTPPWGIEFRYDLLNAFVIVVTTFIGFISAVYAKQSVEQEVNEDKIPAFYAVYVLFMVGLFGMIATGDIFNLYVFLEITSLAGYALIATGKRRYSSMASFNYLILGTIAATFIVLGIGYLYMATGTLNMQDLAKRLPEVYESKVVFTGLAFIIVGLLIKMAVFPLHLWLPDAYKYSPSVVSAAMSATSTKVAAYVMVRILFTVFEIEYTIAGIPVTTLFIYIASVGVIAGSVLAISQSNIKLMLAYSSVGQIGYIVLAAAMMDPVALSGGILHILNHALMKGGLFFVVGAVVYRTGSEYISDMSGLGKRMPWSAFAFTIFALSIIGVPLTVGFVSKWYLVAGAIASQHWFVIPVILLSSLLTAIYFGRVINVMYFSKPQEGAAVKNEAPMGMVAPTLVVAALCIIFGIAASLPIEIASKAATAILGGAAW